VLDTNGSHVGHATPGLTRHSTLVAFPTLATVAGATFCSPLKAHAAAEWSLDLSNEWKVTKKLDSMIRIQAN